MFAQSIHAITHALNGTMAALQNASDTAAGAPVTAPTDVSSLFAFLLSFSALHDWIKLFIIGGAIETFRRFVSSMYYSFIESFFLTIRFEDEDEAFSWMMVWLARQKTFQRVRDLQISTRSWGLNSGPAVLIPGEEMKDSESVEDKKNIAFLPSFDVSHSFIYKGYWMRATRSQRHIRDGAKNETLIIRVLSRNHDIVNKLLLDAKKTYESEEQHRVPVYIADAYNNWYRSGSRPKRPMESIVLDPGVKDMLIEDAKDFLSSEAWYTERGIPFRRGYLLYGVPGSGKTSLIHAIAGALNLDIYVISLAKRGLDDSSLNELICELPTRSIALMEDIDAAFTRGITREDSSKTDSNSNSNSNNSRESNVTLSGLLSAIDGVAAQEGRLLFATTNKYTALDPALSRPGRMDLHIEFGYASKWQAEELFKRFYPSRPSSSPSEDDDNDDDTDDLPGYPLTKEDLYGATPAPEKEALLLANGDPKSSFTRYPRAAPNLRPHVLQSLATRFANAIPDRELSMAALQGHLMTFKSRPVEAVDRAAEFVEKERERVKAIEGKKIAEQESVPQTPLVPPAKVEELEKADNLKPPPQETPTVAAV